MLLSNAAIERFIFLSIRFAKGKTVRLRIMPNINGAKNPFALAIPQKRKNVERITPVIIKSTLLLVVICLGRC